MTKEQIAALIAAKIAGQGSMVDIGGALPEILTALAENGISTDMTVAEQMQARKDLGLYYEETTTGEKTVQYTDEPESATLSGYAKISDDTPTKEDIISVGNSEPNMSIDFDDGFLIAGQYPDVPLGTEYRVVLNDSFGNEPGIYWHIGGISGFPLKYNGEITTISKVPERFLPVAWNQLVTEGTKIAEVTIGEETTEVFAPDGGGDSVPATLEITSKLVSGNDVDMQATYGLSNDDMENILSGKILALNYPPNGGDGGSYLLKSTYDDGDMSRRATFVDENGISYTISKYGESCDIRKEDKTIKPLSLTGLPTAEMTTPAQLEAIGVTADSALRMANGLCTGLIIRESYGMAKRFVPLLYAYSYSDLSFTFSFHYVNDTYVVQFDDSTATVTVTPD